MYRRPNPPLTPPKRGIADSDSPPLEGPGVGSLPTCALWQGQSDEVETILVRDSVGVYAIKPRTSLSSWRTVGVPRSDRVRSRARRRLKAGHQRLQHAAPLFRSAIFGKAQCLT